MLHSSSAVTCLALASMERAGGAKSCSRSPVGGAAHIHVDCRAAGKAVCHVSGHAATAAACFRSMCSVQQPGCDTHGSGPQHHRRALINDSLSVAHEHHMAAGHDMPSWHPTCARGM